jgi:hypothetical protein
MGVRIAHITGHTGRLPTKQITVNRELFLEEKKICIGQDVKKNNNTILEVKFENEVSSYFLLNRHDHLIDFFYFSKLTWGGPYKRILCDTFQRNSKVSSETMASRRKIPD